MVWGARSERMKQARPPEGVRARACWKWRGREMEV